MSILIFILILVALILVHEFGHFVVAKFFKIKVEEFGIFFPPRLFKIKKGETTYSFNALPFGGFVRIFGENYNEHASEPRSFAGKPRYVQAAVVVAGVVMNVVFAWGMLSVGYMAGLPTSASHDGLGMVRDAQTLVVGVLPGSPADKSDVKARDVIVGVGTATASGTGEDAAQVRQFIAEHENESIVLMIERAGEERAFVIRAEEGLIEERKVVGLLFDDVGLLTLPPHLALVEGARLTYDMTVAIAQGLGTFFAQIARGVADFNSVAGPIGIVNIGADTIQGGFAAAAMLTALISINLAIINLLPIPGLDGGRLVIIAVEGVLRRPVSRKLTVALTVVGFALLITLMIVVSVNDIARLVG